MAPAFHHDVERCIEAIISDVGRNLVLGIPNGIGKPNHLVNALFARAMQDSSLSLKIYTGLSFVRPQAGGGLEGRFSGPIIERLFQDYPALTYAEAVLRCTLPPNIEVYEFFLQAGAFLNAPLAQQNYTSLNYTHIARYLVDRGVNVLAQLVARRGEGSALRFSAGSNTDITLDILPLLAARRQAGAKIAIVGQVNAAMPFMTHLAELPAARFDHILEAPAYEFPLFAPPKSPVSLQDYAAAIHAASLVRDGGTIQLGIGTFSDAMAHTLILRQDRNDLFASLSNNLGCGRLHPALPCETGRFDKGLYAATELFVDGYLALYRAGILKRRVFGDVETQRRAEAGELGAGEYARGAVLHGGFFFGPLAFYETLRNFAEEDQRAFRMTGISFVNALYGDEDLKRAHRRHARFINSAMMVTLLGDVISDQLDDGRVVSGVGGQYNFIAQAHELEDGRSIIELGASRLDKGRPRSNIRWSYGHTTIPRHLRDVIVTEYGAADLRGLSDRDTIAAMLAIADSRFQDELLSTAKSAKKIEKTYQIPHAYRNNTPERIEVMLGPLQKDGSLPPFPFGTDMTAEETALLPALSQLKAAQSSVAGLARILWRGRPWLPPDARELALLRRMDLEGPKSATAFVHAALVLGAIRTQ
jgi:acyl-CoA hydrolase